MRFQVVYSTRVAVKLVRYSHMSFRSKPASSCKLTEASEAHFEPETPNSGRIPGEMSNNGSVVATSLARESSINQDAVV